MPPLPAQQRKASQSETLVLMSSSNYSSYVSRPWGSASLGDRPVPGDYDGDGLDDVAVWRANEGTWWVTRSSTGDFLSVPWGGAALGDVPIMAR